MSTLLGDARIRLRADTSGFEGEAKGSILGSVSRIGKAAAVAFAGGAVAAGGFGLKIAADMEQAQIGFETMLGSGEKASAFLKDLQSFAAKTPFEFPELQGAASKLVAVGTDTARVIPLMTALGDSTAAMGTGAEGIDRAVTALQQMRVKGKVTGEEMLQLAEAGVPAWEALASQLGVTTGEAQDMVSKGKVSVDDLYTAIETRQGESLGRTAGMMDQQAQSLVGLWSTVKDTVQMSLAGMMEPLIPSIKAGLDKAAPVIESVLGGIGDSMKVLISGNFDSGMFGGAFEEDSKYVDVLFKIRDGFGFIKDSATVLLTGDFKSGMFGGKVGEDSKYVDLLFDIRDTLAGFWGSVKDSLGNLRKIFVDLGPLISVAFGGAVGIALTVLQELGPVIESVTGFLAENEWVIYGLIGAYGLLRLATLSHAAALAVQATGGLVAWIAQTNVAQAATKAWTAVQWALNAALNASPIIIAVTALAALAGAVVYAWNNVDWFRDAVVAAWEWIKNAAVNVWEGFLKPIFAGMVVAWNNVASAFSWAWTNVLQPVFTTLWDVVTVLWTSVLQPIFGLIGSVFVATFDLMAWSWNNVLSPVFSAIGAIVSGLWNGILSPIFSAIGAGWSLLADGFQWAWANVLSPMFTAFGNAVDWVADAFDTAVSAIGTAWDKVKSFIATPINWVINTVWNDGILAAWNWVSDKIWGGDPVAEFPEVSFATGGIMPGYSPGVDIHKFYSPTGGILNLSGGEAIMRPEFTKAIGAAGVDALNQAARSGNLSDAWRKFAFMGDLPNSDAAHGTRSPIRLFEQSFDKGGVWEVPGIAKPFIPNWFEDKISAWMNSPYVEIVGGAIEKTLGSLWDMLKAKIVEFGSVEGLDDPEAVAQNMAALGVGGERFKKGLEWALTQAGKPYQWAGAGNPSWDCSGFMGAITRVIRGQSPGRIGATANFPWPGFGQVGGVGSTVGFVIGSSKDTGSGIGHMAGTLLGVPVESNGSQGVIVGKGGGAYQKIFNTHAALYDQGGLLPPGLTVAHNKTGRPEYVMTGEQLADQQRPIYNITVNADRDADDIADKIVSVLRDHEFLGSRGGV